jgi:hypothetical protein
MRNGNPEGPSGLEGAGSEPLTDHPVRGGVGMQGVGERVRGGVGFPVERQAVEVVQVRVLGRPLRHDLGQLLADHPERQLPTGPFSRVARGAETQPAGTQSVEVDSAGAGVSSWIAQWIGETTSRGVVG